MQYVNAMAKALIDIMYMASEHAMEEATAGWSHLDWLECNFDFDYEEDSPYIAKALSDIQHFAATHFPEN